MHYTDAMALLGTLILLTGTLVWRSVPLWVALGLPMALLALAYLLGRCEDRYER